MGGAVRSVTRAFSRPRSIPPQPEVDRTVQRIFASGSGGEAQAVARSAADRRNRRRRSRPLVSGSFLGVGGEPSQGATQTTLGPERK